MNVIVRLFGDRFAPKLGREVTTELTYKFNERAWLLSDGYGVLDPFVNALCSLVYERSTALRDEENEFYEDCYDSVADVHFPQFETDFYPPNGYRSIFFKISSPFLDAGTKNGLCYSCRYMKIFMGRIDPNPQHGKNNASHAHPPRLRKSILVEEWGFSVGHYFLDDQPTPNFSYSLTNSDLSLQGEYSTNYIGLLSLLKLVVVTGGHPYCPVKGALATDIQAVRNALSKANGTLVNPSVYSEEWRPETSSWQPFIDVKSRSGWFSSKIQRLYIAT